MGNYWKWTWCGGEKRNSFIIFIIKFYIMIMYFIAVDVEAEKELLGVVVALDNVPRETRHLPCYSHLE